MQMIRITAQTRACGAIWKRYLRLGDFDGFKFGNWYGRQNGMKSSLVTSHASAILRCLHSSLETQWRDDAEQLRYAPPHWSCTKYYGMGRLFFLTFRACLTAIFNRITRGTHCPRFLLQSPDWTASMTGLLYRSFADRKHVVHGCSTTDPDYIPCCHTRLTLATCGICLLCCTPRTHPKSFRINAEACGSGDLQQWRLLWLLIYGNHTSQKSINLIIWHLVNTLSTK